MKMIRCYDGWIIGHYRTAIQNYNVFKSLLLFRIWGLSESLYAYYSVFKEEHLNVFLN